MHNPVVQKTIRPRSAALCVALAVLLQAPAIHGEISTTNFFNWETAPVHPVELSPDGNTLAVCNLPDGRLELFTLGSGHPVALGSVSVGIDPVTVRFRTPNELWVANYISDTISIVDLPSLRVMFTLTCSNEPSDIVFAGIPQLAYVSCGQPNLVQVFNPLNFQQVTNIAIDGNRPRAMAVSPDLSTVYVAVFESGNASTIIGNGVSIGLPRPSIINSPNTPSRGQNPFPNDGTNFNPAINPALTNPPPRVGLIVKRNQAGRWLDDNEGDWTEYITGTNAAFTGRVPGWAMPDHDLAVIHTADFQVNYATGLMNICMAVAVNPVSGRIAVVGTDASNEVRFESRLNGKFVRVNLAQVEATTLAKTVKDLNPHLTYATASTTAGERNKSVGDPRAIVWDSSGQRGYVTGMGSDNLVVIDQNGDRVDTNSVLALDAGPTGLALDETRHLLYVYNRFAGSLLTVSTDTRTVTATNALFDPTPGVIKAGRPHLYNTHLSSGLGQAACASCHVDGRFDRLAWDLGEPSGSMKWITNDFNFLILPATSNGFHPMKGPMTTQTLQDIISHEPFHWRGDREGIEQFDATFTNLQGTAVGLSTNEMQDFKMFLATIRFAPNPYRPIDNSLPTSLPLPGQRVLGRDKLNVGSQLPNGNAVLGQGLFRTNTAQGCLPCHTLPTGLGTDFRFSGFWSGIRTGTNNAHHVASVQLERNLNLPFKIPALRNLFDKFGADFDHTNSRAGFGFGHDGSTDSLVRFVQDGFGITNDNQTANLIAFLFSFTGSDLLPGSPVDITKPPGVPSLDTPASCGRQLTLTNPASVALLNTMLALASSPTGRVDLVVKGFADGLPRAWLWDRNLAVFISDRQTEPALLPAALRALAGPGTEQTYTLVPRGVGIRLGLDRDGDGYLDRDELDFGSDPANALSLATNTPPSLFGPANYNGLKGRTATLAYSAVDTDVPAQKLTYSLSADAPPGAFINSTNGQFTWILAGTNNPATNTFQIIVRDNGTPPQSNSLPLTIVSEDISLEYPLLDAAGLTVRWKTFPGLRYRVQYKNNLEDSLWTDLPDDVVATNDAGLKLDAGATTNKSRFYRVIALP